MSKFKDLIKEARKTEEQPKTEEATISKKESGDSGNRGKKISRILENNKLIIEEEKREEKLVGISIKVEENLRQHWAIEAKRKRKSMTSVIIKALIKEFGEP